MKRNLLRLVIAVIFFYSFKVNAQAPNWLWAQNASASLGEEAAGIASDASGNVYVTGKFSSASITFGTTTLTNAGLNTFDLFVAKYDMNGNIQWAKSAGSSESDIGFSIGSDALGNTYVTGQFTGASITFDGIVLNNTQTPASDIFVVKYDPNGNASWAKSYGGTGIDVSYAIEVTANGEYYLAGDFSGDSITIDTHVLVNTATGFTDMFIAKFDSSGNSSWVTQASGGEADRPYDIGVDVFNNCYVTGATKSITLTSGTVNVANTNVSGASYDGFVIKFGPSGTAIWGRALGGLQDDFGYGVSVSPSGYVYLTGTFSSTQMSIGLANLSTVGTFDIFMASYDIIGNPIWGQGMGTAGAETAKGVVADVHGYAYFTGRYDGQIMVTKADSLGSVIWTKLTGDSTSQDNGNAICMDMNEDCIVAGSYGSTLCDFDGNALANAGMQDFFIAKLTTGITSVEENVTTFNSVYPNPSSGLFTISFGANEKNADIQVFNSIGENVYCDFSTGEQLKKIDLSNQPAGVYYIRINSGAEYKIQKLIISK